MVRTSPSIARDAVLILGQGTEIPHASRPENYNMKNRSNIVTNSKKTFRRAHIKKNFNQIKSFITGSSKLHRAENR